MTLQRHPMDSHRPNDFLEDIMSEEELEQHNRELRALQARNARHDLAVKRAKFKKFDRFEELVTKHEEINFQLLKAYDLNVNDAVSIAYSIIGQFAFDYPLDLGGMDWMTDEEQVEKGVFNSVREYAKKNKAEYAYLEEAMIVAFTKFRGGKLNRRVPNLAFFLKSLDEELRLDIRSFYAQNNGSSDWVHMIHELICAYKFDNQDNEKQQRPLLFDYDNRSTKFNNFFEFFAVAYLAINYRDYELINSLVAGRHYHYKEIQMIEEFVQEEYEKVFYRMRSLDIFKKT